MKTQLSQLKRISILFLGLVLGFALNAQVLFHTDFQAAEGWVAEGSASSTGKLLERNITFNGQTFLIKFNQVAINPIDNPNGDCSMGSANIQKNGKSDYLQVSTTTNNNGYILLPDFNEDVTVSFGHGSGTSRRIAIETSSDDGISWQVAEDDIAPLLASGCATFKSPTKFAKGTKLRITNHTNGGGLKIYWLTVEKYVVDTEAPIVEFRSPAVDSTEVTPATRSVILEFNEPVKSGGDGKVFVVGNTSGDLLELTSDGLLFDREHVTIPFPTSFFLNHNETYTVLIEDGAIKDLANNSTGIITWAFTTKVVVSSEKEIIDIKIPKMVGAPVIDSAAGTVNIVMGFGSDLANIQPSMITFTISGFANIVNDYKDYSAGPQTYVITAEDRSQKTWTITMTVADFKVASLPVIYKGDVDHSWKYIVADGWSILNVNDDSNTKMNNYSFYQANLSQANQYLQNQFNAEANRISFRARYGNATSNYVMDLSESADGETWTEVVKFTPSELVYDTDGVTLLQPTAARPDPAPMLPTSSSSFGLRSYPLLSTSRYIRWFYTTRTNTTFYIDDVVIEKADPDAVAPTFDSETPVETKIYSNLSKSQIIFKMSETVKVAPAIIARTSGIKVSDGTVENVYYEPNILSFRDGEVAITDIPALVDQAEYTVTIPNDALVDLNNNPFAGTSFTFKFNIETGVNRNFADNVEILISNKFIHIKDAKSIQIYNTTGSLIQSAQQNSLSVNSLQNGIYIVRYQLQNGMIGASKVLIR